MCKKFIKKAKDCGVVQVRSKKKNFWSKVEVFLKPVFLVVLLAFVVMYLGAINNRATSGYKISGLEKELTEARELYEKLSIESIELQQVSRVKELALLLEMVETNEVDYLSVDTEGLAVR